MHLAIETNIPPYNYWDVVGKKWHTLGILAKVYIGPSAFLFVVRKEMEQLLIFAQQD